MSQAPPPGGGQLSELQAERRRKVTELAARGVPAWGVDFHPDHRCAEAAAMAPPEPGELGERVSVAGRLLRLRRSGGIAFADCYDESGRLQLLASREVAGAELLAQMEELDLGDLVGATGRLTCSRSGEPSLALESVTLLAKSLRPPAGKHRGVVDQELRYRRRYLDLLTEPSHRDIFRQRSAIVSALRRVLAEHRFMEVETPTLQAIPGGGDAHPFQTHHHALHTDLYLRIALELYLKRLLVSGFERVYEMGRVFRNEGISPRHNPEFTMLEAYEAYGNLRSMMDLGEALVWAAVEACAAAGGPSERDSPLRPPYRRQSMVELVAEVAGIAAEPIWDEPSRLAEEAVRKGVELQDQSNSGRILFAIYEQLVEPKLIRPTFVTDYPIEVSPLARSGPDPRFTERFELVVDARELSNAFSELNDPLEQRRRLLEQAGRRRSGDLEAQMFDEDFVEALEYGMPPAGGIGMGVDRLVMVVTGATTIRDVVLFPTLRPESRDGAAADPVP